MPSDKPSGTVTAQDPSAGTSLVEGATVRINYSTGPKQVAVPPVVGLDYSTALQQLQAAGFAVARTDVESDAAGGGRRQPGAERIVDGDQGLDRQPLGLERAADDAAAGRHRARREADATATLKAAGFKVQVTPQDTDVETFDGVVISQDPAGNSQQDPNTVVTLFVGNYVPPPVDTTTTDDDTTTTTTTPTP